MNLYAILLMGLFAGGVSCAAVQGGLLAGLVMRQRQHAVPPSDNPATAATFAARLADDLAPVAGFLTGKLGSHTLLGALLGAGQVTVAAARAPA